MQSMRYCAHYSSTNITTFNDLKSYMKSYQYSHFRDEETVRVLQPANDQSRIHTQVCFTFELLNTLLSKTTSDDGVDTDDSDDNGDLKMAGVPEKPSTLRLIIGEN